MDDPSPEDIRKEITACRNRLVELNGMAGIGAPISKDPPRISIRVTRGEFEEIQALALRSSTSISALGQMALKHLLIQARAGALPMLPPSTADNAIEVTVLGRPLV